MVKFMNILLFSTAIIVVLIICYHVVAQTGYIKRGYSVLLPGQKVTLADETTSVENLAATYQPILFMQEGTTVPTPQKMFWEAIDTKESVAIVYRTFWEDEVHPRPIVHYLYALYRSAFYTIHDIEYIQINISKKDKTINRIRYEDTAADSYHSTIVPHRYVTINKQENSYEMIFKDGKKSNGQARKVSIVETRLKFGVASWSHQFTLLENGSDRYSIRMNIPLEYLTEEDYVKYKLARRSQGDFVTKENPVMKCIGIIILVTIMGIPYLFLRLKK